MIKIPSLVTLALLLLCFESSSQLAVINGRDGFTNIRESENRRSKIIGRIFNHDFFRYSEQTTDKEWVQVFFDVVLEDASPKAKAYYRGNPSDTLHISGFILKSRIVPLSMMPQSLTKLVENSSGDMVQLTNDSILLTVKLKPFVESEHKVTRDENGLVTKIDGIVPVGSSGNLPKKQFGSIEMIMNGKIVKFPVEAYKNLYEPDIHSIYALDGKQGNLYLYVPDNGIAGHAYSVAWLFYKKRFVRRCVAFM